MLEVGLSEEKVVPRAPRSLKERGKAMWRELFTKYEFDPQETDLVWEVCRTLDAIDALSASVEADGLMISGSTGQKVLHPAVAELRQQQASFARLVQMLNLPAIEGGVATQRADSAKASAAANARWRRRA